MRVKWYIKLLWCCYVIFESKGVESGYLLGATATAGGYGRSAVGR